MKKTLKVSWMSAGVSSFVATYISKNVDKIIYIDIDDHHPDNKRFIKDCENVLNCEIEILKSPLQNVENAIRSASVIKMPYGFAPCTNYLKKRVRKEWEDSHSNYIITYVWGFDKSEEKRAEMLVDAMPNFYHEFPLIDNSISKKEAHYMCEKLGIKRPIMYDLGYNNNNCIGCIKGGMGYWNKIRVDFPEVFEKRAKLERLIGHSIIKGCYLDELDINRGRMSELVLPECDVFCQFNGDKS